MTWAKLALQILSLISKLLAFLKIMKAKQEGREEVSSEINKSTEKLKDEFEKIDTTDRSFDDAIGRLHELAHSEVPNAGASKTDPKHR